MQNTSDNLPLFCGRFITWLKTIYIALILRKTLNNNDHNQAFWVRETEHPQQTIVLTKTAGQQPGSVSLLSKVFQILIQNLNNVTIRSTSC